MTKPRILEAVREGEGEGAAQLIDHLKKPDMAREAERLLADSGWLPEPLRLRDADQDATPDEDAEAPSLPAFLTGDAQDTDPDAADDPAHAILSGAGEDDSASPLDGDQQGMAAE